MNKTELIEHLATKHALTKAEAGRILETLMDAVVTTVKKGGAVSIPGFGSFKQHARAARTGVNPSTGDKIKIAAAKLPKFTPGAASRPRSIRRLPLARPPRLPHRPRPPPSQPPRQRPRRPRSKLYRD